MAVGPGRDPAKERRWRALIAEQGRSGRTIEAFCQMHGLASSAFHFWKRELRTRNEERRSARQAKAKRTVAPRFLSVRLADATTAGTPHSAALLELALPGGEVLRVPAGFDSATLARVLAVLRGEPAC